MSNDSLERELDSLFRNDDEEEEEEEDEDGDDDGEEDEHSDELPPRDDDPAVDMTPETLMNLIRKQILEIAAKDKLVKTLWNATNREREQRIVLEKQLLAATEQVALYKQAGEKINSSYLELKKSHDKLEQERTSTVMYVKQLECKLSNLKEASEAKQQHDADKKRMAQLKTKFSDLKSEHSNLLGKLKCKEDIIKSQSYKLAKAEELVKRLKVVGSIVATAEDEEEETSIFEPLPYSPSPSPLMQQNKVLGIELDSDTQSTWSSSYSIQSKVQKPILKEILKDIETNNNNHTIKNKIIKESNKSIKQRGSNIPAKTTKTKTKKEKSTVEKEASLIEMLLQQDDDDSNQFNSVGSEKDSNVKLLGSMPLNNSEISEMSSSSSSSESDDDTSNFSSNETYSCYNSSPLSSLPSPLGVVETQTILNDLEISSDDDNGDEPQTVTQLKGKIIESQKSLSVSSLPPQEKTVEQTKSVSTIPSLSPEKSQSSNKALSMPQKKNHNKNTGIVVSSQQSSAKTKGAENPVKAKIRTNYSNIVAVGSEGKPCNKKRIENLIKQKCKQVLPINNNKPRVFNPRFNLSSDDESEKEEEQVKNHQIKKTNSFPVPKHQELSKPKTTEILTNKVNLPTLPQPLTQVSIAEVPPSSASVRKTTKSIVGVRNKIQQNCLEIVAVGSGENMCNKKLLENSIKEKTRMNSNVKALNDKEKEEKQLQTKQIEPKSTPIPSSYSQATIETIALPSVISLDAVEPKSSVLPSVISLDAVEPKSSVLPSVISLDAVEPKSSGLSCVISIDAVEPETSGLSCVISIDAVEPETAALSSVISIDAVEPETAALSSVISIDAVEPKSSVLPSVISLDAVEPETSGLSCVISIDAVEPETAALSSVISIDAVEPKSLVLPSVSSLGTIKSESGPLSKSLMPPENKTVQSNEIMLSTSCQAESSLSDLQPDKDKIQESGFKSVSVSQNSTCEKKRVQHVMKESNHNKTQGSAEVKSKKLERVSKVSALSSAAKSFSSSVNEKSDSRIFKTLPSSPYDWTKIDLTKRFKKASKNSTVSTYISHTSLPSSLKPPLTSKPPSTSSSLSTAASTPSISSILNIQQDLGLSDSSSSSEDKDEVEKDLVKDQPRKLMSKQGEKKKKVYPKVCDISSKKKVSGPVTQLRLQNRKNVNVHINNANKQILEENESQQNSKSQKSLRPLSSLVIPNESQNKLQSDSPSLPPQSVRAKLRNSLKLTAVGSGEAICEKKKIELLQAERRKEKISNHKEVQAKKCKSTETLECPRPTKKSLVIEPPPLSQPDSLENVIVSSNSNNNDHDVSMQVSEQDSQQQQSILTSFVPDLPLQESLTDTVQEITQCNSVCPENPLQTARDKIRSSLEIVPVGSGENMCDKRKIEILQQSRKLKTNCSNKDMKNEKSSHISNGAVLDKISYVGPMCGKSSKALLVNPTQRGRKNTQPKCTIMDLKNRTKEINALKLNKTPLEEYGSVGGDSSMEILDSPAEPSFLEVNENNLNNFTTLTLGEIHEAPQKCIELLEYIFSLPGHEEIKTAQVHGFIRIMVENQKGLPVIPPECFGRLIYQEIYNTFLKQMDRVSVKSWCKNIAHLIIELKILYPREYEALDNAIVSYFSKTIIGNLAYKFQDDRMLHRLGNYYGVMCWELKNRDLARTILISTARYRQAQMLSLASGFIKSCPFFFKFDSFSNFNFVDKALTYLLSDPPKYYDSKYYIQVKKIIITGLKLPVPKVTFPNFFQDMWDNFKRLEVSSKIDEGKEILELLLLQADWGHVLQSIRNTFANTLNDWRRGKLLDNIFAAYLRIIVSVCATTKHVQPGHAEAVKNFSPVKEIMDEVDKLDKSSMSSCLTTAITSGLEHLAAIIKTGRRRHPALLPYTTWKDNEKRKAMKKKGANKLAGPSLKKQKKNLKRSTKRNGETDSQMKRPKLSVPISNETMQDILNPEVRSIVKTNTNSSSKFSWLERS